MPCRAQDAATAHRRDSLERLIRQAPSDTAASRLFHPLAETWFESDPQRALSLEDSAYARAARAGNRERQALAWVKKASLYRRLNQYNKANTLVRQALVLAGPSSAIGPEAFLELGISLLRLGYLDSSLAVLHQGLAALQQHPDGYTEGLTYNMMGNVLREQNRYDDALSNYIQALKIFEGIHSNFGRGQALSNLGNLHNLMGNTDKALEYAQQSLDIAKAGTMKSAVAYSHRLLGRIYRKQKKTDEALRQYEQAAQIYRLISARRDLGETLLSTGNIYFDRKEYDLAARRYREGMSVTRSIGDSVMRTYLFSALGATLLEQKKNTEALRYLDSTLLFARLKKLPTMRMDAHQFRSVAYEDMGHHRQALEEYKKYRLLLDSLNGVQDRNAAAELEARYQTEKKDDAIRLLNAENELKAEQLRSKNNLRNFLVILLVLSLLVIGVTYNRYKVKLRANQKLKELDEIKSRFFTNVSHEFRTPLSLIIGPLQEKLKGSPNSDNENLSLMYRSARRLQDLINQVLDLSRIEAGSLQLHLEEGDLSSLLKFIGGTFASMADRRSVAYTVDVFQAPYIGCYDRDKLEKILYNLLSNAFKFTPEGGAIRFHARIEHDVVRVEVKDSGRGIPADQLSLIFTRFYRIDESATRTTDGSGIGLALAKELAELHRGKITVSSHEGIGSVFTLTLPVHRKAYPGLAIAAVTPASATQVSTDYEHPEPAAAEPERDGKPLVMVAEDHTDMQRFIRQILLEHYHVITANDGQEAWEKIQALVPDLVVSDWMMPRMDGRTLCEKLKTDNATCHIPVLMLTAKADHPSKMEGLETGADDYLTKPFDTHELQVRIHNLIEQRHRLRAVFSTQLVLKPGEVALASRDATFLKNVMAYLEEKYADPDLGVEAFAEQFSMSRMQLHRKLKALTDQSPGDFLRRFRLDRAKQLLGEQGVQVSEVCFRVGFNNVANFSKAFREHTGKTPSEFMGLAVEKN